MQQLKHSVFLKVSHVQEPCHQTEIGLDSPNSLVTVGIFLGVLDRAIIQRGNVQEVGNCVARTRKVRRWKVTISQFQATIHNTLLTPPYGMIEGFTGEHLICGYVQLVQGDHG
jgi:hypothetical protein